VVNGIIKHDSFRVEQKIRWTLVH